MDEKKQLELIGITYNQIQSGVYALVLGEVGGKRCIPIVVGSAEAQSIECRLQNIITPRPLTHDLMANMIRAFGVHIKEIFIRRMDDGVFAADIHIIDGDSTLVMDARSSDAIALAVRMGSPIFTSEQLLDEIGFVPKRIVKRDISLLRKDIDDVSKAIDNNIEQRSLKKLSENQLQKLLTEAVEKEYYEEAARIKNELLSRKQNSGNA